MMAAQRGEPFRGVLVTERHRALLRHLVEDGGRDQKFAVLRGHLTQYVRRKIPMERVDSAPGPGDVARGAPGLEEDTGDPAARRSDDLLGILGSSLKRRQSLPGLVWREGQIGLIDRG